MNWAIREIPKVEKIIFVTKLCATIEHVTCLRLGLFNWLHVAFRTWALSSPRRMTLCDYGYGERSALWRQTIWTCLITRNTVLPPITIPSCRNQTFRYAILSLDGASHCIGANPHRRIAQGRRLSAPCTYRNDMQIRNRWIIIHKYIARSSYYDELSSVRLLYLGGLRLHRREPWASLG